MANYSTQSVVYGQAFIDTILAALKTTAAGPLVATAKLRLSADPTFNPTPTSTIAALAANEVNYSGYTAGGAAVVLSVPLNLTVDIQGVQTTALFVATTASPFVPSNAYGWWIDDGTNFIAGEAFAGSGPFNFAAPGDFLEMLALLPLQLFQNAA